MVKKQEAIVEQQAPSEERPIDATMLVIHFSEDGIPQFKYNGMWTIREVLKVKRLLGLTFRRYRNELRKKLIQEDK